MVIAVRDDRVIFAMERNDGNIVIAEQGEIRKRTPHIAHGPDAEGCRILGIDLVDRPFVHGIAAKKAEDIPHNAAPGTFRTVFLAHESQIQCRNGPGARTCHEYPLRIDPIAFLRHEKAHRRTGVLQRPVTGPFDFIRKEPESHPVIDRRGHIAQRGKVAAPAFEFRLRLVAIIESASVNHHKQRPRAHTTVLREIDIQGERTVPFPRQLACPVEIDLGKALVPYRRITGPEAARPAINHIFFNPYTVRGIMIRFYRRAVFERRGFIGTARESAHTAVRKPHPERAAFPKRGDTHCIGIHRAGVPVKKALQPAFRVNGGKHHDTARIDRRSVLYIIGKAELINPEQVQ